MSETMKHERPKYLDYASRLADLGLDPLEQARVLEWYANKVWVANEEGSGDREYGGKSYDPLKVELDAHGGGIAHSYVFDFLDGRRHHPFASLAQLEDWLLEEAIGGVKYVARWTPDE